MKYTKLPSTDIKVSEDLLRHYDLGESKHRG